MPTKLDRRRQGRRQGSVVVPEVDWDDVARRGRLLLLEAFERYRGFAQDTAVEGRGEAFK